jgi:hypothetical protein
MTAILGLFVLVAGWMVWSADRAVPSGAVLTSRPAKVVLFGLPHVGLDDLGSGATPNLDRLVDRGAVGAMTVRTLSGRPDSTEGYAALNAGAKVRALNAASVAYPADAEVENSRARQVMARRTGRTPSGDIVVLGYPQAVLAIAGKHVSSEPGALGDALHAAGLRTAAVGNADAPGSNDPRVGEVSRPIAMAVVDRLGSVDAGRVDGGLLRADPSAPFGVISDPRRMVAETIAALRDADVVAVDPGDLDRMHNYRGLELDRAAKANRNRALRHTDAILGAIASRLPSRTLLLVASVSPPTGGPRLTPLVAIGSGVPRGMAFSRSVRHAGVATLTDLAPTVLAALRAPIPTGMTGHALRYEPGRADVGALQRLERDASYREDIYFPLVTGFIVVQGVLYAVALVVLASPDRWRALLAPLRSAVVAVAAFPLATFLFRAVPGVAALGSAGLVVLVAIDAGIAAIAARARRDALGPLMWIAWSTVALFVVDIGLGGRLQYSSVLGYSYFTAARFFGLGNTAFAVLAASGLIAACLVVEHNSRRREGLLIAACVLALVALMDGAPWLGADFGGLLTLLLVSGVTMVALWRGRISWRWTALVLGGVLLVVSIVAGIDLLRPPETRTHLGRFVADAFGGNRDQSGTTVARKAATNLRVLGTSVWMWLVPISAAYAITLLAFVRRGQSLLPRGSARRVGFAATVAVGAMGFAVNDSGIVVAAVVAIYIGPYLTLLALSAPRSEVAVHPASGTLDPRSPPADAAPVPLAR